MENLTETGSGRRDKFLNVHKSPSTVIYISLFLSSLLSLPATKTPGMALRRSQKRLGREMSEIHESEYAIWQLSDHANRETCQIHHPARIKFEFEL